MELYKDRPPLKLPYNVGDDPQMTAHNFLQRNDVDERFLETVTNYIRSRTASCDSVPAETTVSDTSTGITNAAVIISHFILCIQLSLCNNSSWHDIDNRATCSASGL